MSPITTQTFHGYYDEKTLAFNPGSKTGEPQTGWERLHKVHEYSFKYAFSLHQHPYVGQLVRRLLAGSVAALEAADTEYEAGKPLSDGSPRPVLYEEFFEEYKPQESVSKSERAPYPVRELDFHHDAAYGVYNWELFFHVPLAVGIHLSKSGRYEDAQRWFHYLFDPTDDSEGPAPARFWKVRPFQTTDVESIEGILVNLATGKDAALQQETVLSIEAWQRTPFDPHLVARFRPSAYMFKTVMAYLDNLIAWGDSLFRQETREAISEATQLYVLAAGILGPKPQEVPNKGRMRPQTYATLQKDLDAFGDAIVELETDVPYELLPMPGDGSGEGGGAPSVASVGSALYFGVPRNDRLLAYWDTVADRLFKIRNSLSFLGIFRQLPLFEPPIDPALLARAAAAGVDVAAIVSGANQPLPLVRYSLLAQKATEICQEVAALGAGLLAALEKRDSEALQILRAQHETGMLERAESVKYGQWQEAMKAREGIEKTLASTLQRYVYYERQLGKSQGEIAGLPDAGTVEASAIEGKRFSAQEPEMPLRQVEYDIAQAIRGLPGAYPMSPWEVTELASIVAAGIAQTAGGALDAAAAGVGLVPQFEIFIEPLGMGGGTSFGGEQLSKMLSCFGDVAKTAASALTTVGTVSQKVGGYQRRAQDWEFQSNLAAAEITQLYKQLRAAQIREALAEIEWHNHQRQIQDAKEIEEFLTNPNTGKTTNKDFYSWMVREVKGLYGRCFELAFDVARQAERALQQELGDQSITFIGLEYMAGNEGLLAGEKLWLDLRRMEMTYHELNRREYELTENISLLELDPNALLELRATGSCTFTIPEALYDLGAPGHYFRRIKSVATTIPSVAGPYTGVNATLTQLKSTIRLSAGPSATGGYAREGTADERFSDYFGSPQSVVTSSGQNDAGLFETNLHDERVLPFEGTGAVGQWQLQLPAGVRQFDYDTIADVILHVRYTAREGGGVLEKAATDNLESLIADAEALGSVRLFSVRHDFPSEWARFKSATIDAAHATAPLSLTLRPEHYPFWSKGRLSAVKSFQLLARSEQATVTVSDGEGHHDALARDAALGDLCVGQLANIPLPHPTGAFALSFDENSMEELWIAIAWGA